MDWKRLRHAAAAAAVPLLQSATQAKMPSRDVSDWPQGKLPHGVEFDLVYTRGWVLYRERAGRCAFPIAKNGDRFQVNIPRPEHWDANVPRFLRGRFNEVVERLLEKSPLPVLVGPESRYLDPAQPHGRQRPKRPKFKGDGFRVYAEGEDHVAYAEGQNVIAFRTNWETCPRTVIVPRAEEWQFHAPPWMSDYDVVMSRLEEHSLHELVEPVASRQAGAHRILAHGTEGLRAPCPACDMLAVAVPSENRNGTIEIDAQDTQRAILARVADGRFEVLRADVAVEHSLDALDREVLWTVTSFFRCTVSGETIAWHLSIHDSPTYWHVTADLPFTWPWTPGHPQVDNLAGGATAD